MAFSSKTLGMQTLVAVAIVAIPFCSISAGDAQYFDRMDKITAGAGNSVAHNIAVQTINPWPRYVHNDRISVDGQRIGLAHKRYQANKSIPPRGLSTSGLSTAVSSSSTNGDSGGGSGSSTPAGDNK